VDVERSTRMSLDGYVGVRTGVLTGVSMGLEVIEDVDVLSGVAMDTESTDRVSDPDNIGETPEMTSPETKVLTTRFKTMLSTKPVGPVDDAAMNLCKWKVSRVPRAQSLPHSCRLACVGAETTNIW
jgi:hypothetical protein